MDLLNTGANGAQVVLIVAVLQQQRHIRRINRHLWPEVFRDD